MSFGKKLSVRAMSMPGGVAAGIGAAVLMTLIGAMILSWLVASERVGEEGIGYGCMVILPLASMVGCLLAWRCIKHRRAVVCAVTAGGYYLALLAIALAFGGIFDGLGVTALLVLLGGGIALIPAFKTNRGGAYRHKKSFSR